MQFLRRIGLKIKHWRGSSGISWRQERSALKRVRPYSARRQRTNGAKQGRHRLTRNIARDKHDARAAVGVAPACQRDRRVDDVLGRLQDYRPRFAFDADDALDAQEAGSAKGLRRFGMSGPVQACKDREPMMQSLSLADRNSSPRCRRQRPCWTHKVEAHRKPALSSNLRPPETVARCTD